MGRSDGYKARRAEADAKHRSPTQSDTPPRPTIQFRPRNDRQRVIQDIWPDAQLIVAVGPAGTGKTACSFAGALRDVFDGKANRVLLARPVIGVDEELGYFPGTLEEKLGPWMGAVEDVTHDVIGTTFEAVAALCEVRSVGLMRGRTVRRATLLTDEAQNCTWKQLVGLCTRKGDPGRIVLCGDIAQSDLPASKTVNGVNPLLHLVRKLRRAKVPGVHIVEFQPEDQVRSPFVREFLTAVGV